MRKHKKIAALLAGLLLCCALPAAPVSAAKGGETADLLPDLYQTTRLPAVVLEGQAEADASPAAVALVRQPNGKIAFMCRENTGEPMEPFYPLSMETGYWDTRLTLNNPAPTTKGLGVVSHVRDKPRTGWDDVFGDIASLGANTVQVMIHWANWEPEQGRFDFSFCDEIVDAAAQHGLKTVFVIFFHYQMNFISPEYDELWMYHLDDREVDGKVKNYAIQWGGYDSIADARAQYKPVPDTNRHEIYLEYWNPKVYPRLMNAITALAQHYKDSPDVLGYQLGNEEGFCNTENGGNDRNPYYRELFQKWKDESGGTQERAFRLATVNALWTGMNNAVHTADPYKFTTSNLQSANVEKAGGFVWADGADLDFYHNLDAVGTMFYGGAANVYSHLDQRYNYTAELPILFPTEIGSTPRLQKLYVAETVERGGQGYGIYCYGELFQNFRGYQGGASANRAVTEQVYSMLQRSMDVLWGALPVKSEQESANYFLAQASDPNATLSVLENRAAGATGILYYKNENASGAAELIVEAILKAPGDYTAQVIGSDSASQDIRIYDAQPGRYEIPVSMNKGDLVFINLRPYTGTGKRTQVSFEPWPAGACLTVTGERGVRYVANSQGRCLLPQGRYTYQAAAPGYETAAGSLVVGGTALTEALPWSSPEPEPELQELIINDSAMGTGINRFSYDDSAWSYYEVENGVRYSGCREGDVHWTPCAEPTSARLEFYGQKLDLKLFHNNATRHSFTISIDGGQPQSFVMPEGIAAFSSGWMTVAEGLENAVHTAVITKTSTGGGQFGIDAARIFYSGEIPQAQAGDTEVHYVNNNDASVTFSAAPVISASERDYGSPQEVANAAAGWAQVKKTSSINSGWTTTTLPGAWYELAFTGTDIKIFSAKEPYLGNQQNALGEVAVYLDGQKLENLSYEVQNPGGFTDHTGEVRGQLSYFPLQVLAVHAGDQNEQHTLRVEALNGQHRIDYATVTARAD